MQHHQKQTTNESSSGPKNSIQWNKYRFCQKCIINSSVPGTTFDEQGICSYCTLHAKLERNYPLDKNGEKKLNDLIAKIKKSGKKRRYDCIIGVSGGRDSIYTLWLAKKVWGLNPLAVHYNEGFGNPVAGENMENATRLLGVDLKTVSADWREAKDIKLAFLKASTPDIEEGTDIGIAAALYSMAHRENVKFVIIGQSFRTEGICPLRWNYLDGFYLKSVHKRFGKVKLKAWMANAPGFNLNLFHLFYYTVIKKIKAVTPLYLVPYNRSQAQKIIEKELKWQDTGAHYFDDLYQSLMTTILRQKFNIDRRLFNYSALIRSGQMSKEQALSRIQSIYAIEDEKIIQLCIKRLGLGRDEFDSIMKLPPKTYRDYPNLFWAIRLMKFPIYLASKLHIIPEITYDKYFKCGS